MAKTEGPPGFGAASSEGPQEELDSSGIKQSQAGRPITPTKGTDTLKQIPMMLTILAIKSWEMAKAAVKDADEDQGAH